MVRKPKFPLVEIVNPQKKTSNRHFGPVSQVNIGNLPAPPYAVTIPVPVPVTDNAGSLTADIYTGSFVNTDGIPNDLIMPANWGNLAIHFRALPYMFNGATWDKIRGTIARGLLVKAEREDLSLAYGTYVAGAAADNAVLGAGGVGIKHKVFACGYTVDAAVQTGFRFNSANPRFCVRRTAGVYAQTFPNPMVSATNVTLTLRVEGACNGDWWVQYVSEA